MNGRASGRAAAPASFGRTLRLLKPDEFSRVFKRNHRSRDECFTVLAAPNELPHPRLGTAVARKASGNAVKRNRLKRLIRESFRTSRTTLPAVDIVVMVKHGAGDVASAKLLQSLTNHWQTISKKCAH